jgi:ubiquinone/menaquinone biosynthesis C-methylase UbiE
VIDPKERFSDRVDDYVRYRPGYPGQVLSLLQRECGLGPGRVVADIGSGTGIFSRLLIASGARVIGVEPNDAMRAAAERALATEDGFISVCGSAEATGLNAASVDVVVVAQAFHWFDSARTRVELARILRPGGEERRPCVVLVWNLRKDTPFLRDYEDFLVRFAPDYGQVHMRERAEEPSVRAFFAPEVPVDARFDHEQRLDEAGLRGRLLSSSYAPRAGHPLHEPMMTALGEVFARHATAGPGEGRALVVPFAYETVVWYAPL